MLNIEMKRAGLKMVNMKLFSCPAELATSAVAFEHVPMQLSVFGVFSRRRLMLPAAAAAEIPFAEHGALERSIDTRRLPELQHFALPSWLPPENLRRSISKQ